MDGCKEHIFKAVIVVQMRHCSEPHPFRRTCPLYCRGFLHRLHSGTTQQQEQVAGTPHIHGAPPSGTESTVYEHACPAHTPLPARSPGTGVPGTQYLQTHPIT